MCGAANSQLAFGCLEERLLMKERLELGELRKLMVALRRKKQEGKLFHPYVLPAV